MIEHLLADGRVQPHAEIEEAGGADLFEDRAARLARAYRAREKAKTGGYLPRCRGSGANLQATRRR